MNKRFSLALFLLSILPLTITAQAPEFAPGARYDAKIPALKQVTGYDFAERVTPPDEIIRYLKALHEAAPERTSLVNYA